MKQVLLCSGQAPSGYIRNLYQQLCPLRQKGLLLLMENKPLKIKILSPLFVNLILLFTLLSSSNPAFSQYKKVVPAKAPVTVSIPADKDNAISSTNSTKNEGSLVNLHVGRTGTQGGNTVQRALFHFDLSRIPAGSKINAATLTLTVTRAKGMVPVALHKLTANWGELESTWSHASLPGTPWTTPGGDFNPTASASTGDVATGPLVISDLTADVQAWVDNPAGNFGWLLKVVNEEPTFTAKLIASRENTVESLRPILSITYTLNEGWDQRYGGLGNEGFTTIIKTADGGYLSGGYTNSNVSGDKTQPSQGKNDYWIVKSDDLGKKLWDKRFGGTDDDYLNRIIQTKDGGFLLAGSSLSGKNGDKTETSRGNRDYWVVKINKEGTKQWDKRYGGSGYDELKKVIQLSTGEYILAGYSNSPAGGDKSQNSQGKNDFWIVKINNTGSKIWDKRYGGNLDEALGGIVQTSDEGYLLGGSSLSGKSGDKSRVNRGGNDFWLIRLDKDGTKIWDKTYGGSGHDEVYSVGKVGNNFFISGQSNSPAGGDKTLGSQGGKDFWLMKISSTGAKVWDQRYGGSLDEELRASIQTRDGGYLLAGKSFSNKSGDKTQDSQGSSDYWIVKTDANGKYQWDKRYGGIDAEELRAVIQGNDGSFLLAGKSTSGVSGNRTQPSQGGYDFWLVKVAPETTPIVTAREIMLVAEPAAEATLSLLQAHPNPSSGTFIISFALPQTQPAQVKVYNSQGGEVANLFTGEAQANQKYQVEWQAGKQASGMYLLQLQTPTQKQQQKLLLTK
ncbi:DNRLRE domain-containing protein [Adhaeribacter radiodurans]|uniref:DNRLRE domain-containing protein n=1 Tax=Adhaeribacter radiodurans TaxID=2745197 RepID=A0A7L7LDX1_9BACT|nr:DNRLRE domain-containing protein [Adhaeribacter radiodurans]QMU31042.1 DNRLRE domain-containing protein [Adhaeribacter radiodurans]